MSKLMALKLIMATFVLLWFGSPTFAQQLSASTSTPCVTKVVEGVCSIALLADTDKCCNTVLNETKADLDCMCIAFDSDSNFLYSFMISCMSSTYDQVIKICQDYLIAQKTTPSSDTPSSPSSGLLTPPSSDIFSPPASSTKSAGSSPVDTSPTSSGTGNQSTTTTIVVSVVITIVVIIIVGVSIFCICRGRAKTRPNTSLPHPYNPYIYNGVEVIKDQGLSSQSAFAHVPPVPLPPISTVSQVSQVSQGSQGYSSVSNRVGFKTDESQQYDLATLQAATNNFSDDNIIGRGGFGYVYKGTLLDGREIAVKRLSPESGQGDTEFKAEIELLAKLQHRNLVQLLGFCLKENEALLVYELLPNKSLDYFLFDDTKRVELKWPTRFQIIKGIARGLLYLHDDAPKRTIHRDLKAPNVLLDAKMNPKISDFGLARMCAVEQTHVYTRNIAGTGDYISPEYRYRGQFSTKSDVYAFGALVLEIISGRSIGSQCGEQAENLMGFAWRCWTDGNPLALMDPMLKDSYLSDEVEKCIHLGLVCVHDDVDKRPDMSTVVHKLNTKPEVGMPQQGLFYNSSSDQSTTTSSTTSQSVTSSTTDASFLAWPQKQK